jgi:DNA repair exonuclease SbcCD ATPase subunit
MSIKKIVELELKYEEAAKNATELGKIVNQQDAKIQQLQGTLDKVQKNTDKASKGFKGFAANIKTIGKVTGIVWLFNEALEILRDTFGKNQIIVDAFKTGTEALSIAFNDFFSFISNNVGTVIGYFKGLFENPIESIKNFSSAIYEGIVARLKQGLEALGMFGQAAVKFFAGDFAGAFQTAKDASKELFDVVTGEDGGYEKIKESVKTAVEGIKEYTKSTIASAKANVELQKTAEIAKVQNQILIEQYDRQAEKLRQIRDDESKTIDERISANKKLGEVLDEQEKAMIANADLIIATAQAQYNKNKNQENYIALLEAQAEKEGVLAQIEGLRSEQLTNINSLEKERADIQKSINEIIEGQLSPYEQLNKERDAKLAELDLLRATEEEKQKIRDQYAELELQLDKATQEAKLQTISQALNGVAALVGQNSAAGKAIAIAQATIDTFVGANKALAQGGIFGAISAAGIIAGGLANVRTITQTKIPNAPEVKSAAPQAPSFNIIGASPENQLAQTLGEREQKPVKAFVVSNEVTNAQALDRNIIKSASLG